MTSPAPNRRRWFRWSLGTMFVVVLVAGCLAGWLGYHLNWIRQRHEVVSRHSVHSELCEVPPSDTPFALRMLGESSYSSISMLDVGPTTIESQEVERIRGLFPEANVHVDILPVAKLGGSEEESFKVIQKLEDEMMERRAQVQAKWGQRAAP